MRTAMVVIGNLMLLGCLMCLMFMVGTIIGTREETKAQQTNKQYTETVVEIEPISSTCEDGFCPIRKK